MMFSFSLPLLLVTHLMEEPGPLITVSPLKMMVFALSALVIGKA